MNKSLINKIKGDFCYEKETKQDKILDNYNKTKRKF